MSSTLTRLANILTLGYAGTRSGQRRVRVIAANSICAFLRLRSRPIDAASLGQVLVVAPHPDDESLGCGATIASLAGAGHSVSVLFLTDGEHSHAAYPEIDPRALAVRRRAEALAATALLGIGPARIRFAQLPDGRLPALVSAGDAASVGILASAITDLRPCTILLPYRRDGSSDHEAAFVLVARAVTKSAHPCRILEFPVWALWSPGRLISPAFSCPAVWRTRASAFRCAKNRAVASYVSQASPLPPAPVAVLPEGFVSMFLERDEFLLEYRAT
ncbi:MAG TPA: PIG-L deacetylase family protein [Opitutaceae bacterium]|jgi:LmbE family N-acetylglucosaminyl deacetylase